MTGRGAVFPARTLTALIAAGALAFAAMSYLLIWGDDIGSRDRAGANSWSLSAIGHHAFVALLRRSGVSVLVSRYESAGRAGDGNLLLMAEPGGAEPPSVQPVGPTLVILPKWEGEPSAQNDRWLGSAAMLPAGRVEAVLRQWVPGARLVRTGPLAPPDVNQLGAVPTLERAQLLSSDRLRPVVATAQGILVGELQAGERRLWVLSDPDVLANHGIGRGDNAAFVLALVDALRPAGGTVVVDETIHGFVQQPSLWRAAFEPPFLLATIQAFAALAVLLWAAVGRFGPPLPAERPFAAGAATLLDTSAGLLSPERHGGHILRRYADAVVGELEERLHAPRRLGAAQRADWLDRLGRARRVGLGYRELAAELAGTDSGRANPARLTALARKLHRWKREMLNGP